LKLIDAAAAAAHGWSYRATMEGNQVTCLDLETPIWGPAQILGRIILRSRSPRRNATVRDITSQTIYEVNHSKILRLLFIFLLLHIVVVLAR